ncbi:hypothetical protein JCM11957_06770 [Caminibacter profundus]
MSLFNIPAPTLIETPDYEAIVERKLNRVKEILTSKGIEYIPSEADDLMTLIEMDAYEEMLLIANTNERIKQQFLAFATGSNLDHIGITRFGVERLPGIKPKAEIEFTLSLAQDYDVVLPKGLMLGNGKDVSYLIDDVVIKAGEISAVGIIELDEEIEFKDIKTEIILTPIAWVVTAKQLTPFSNGASPEDDERYRERIWLSRERRTTAGSRLMYEFYAKSADVRVKEVNVGNGGAGIVKVCYHADEDITDIVRDYLNGEEIRPLTDLVEVEKAIIKEILIDAVLIAKDISLVDLEAVKEKFKDYEERFNIYLSIPKIYDLLTDENIIDVELNSPTEKITTEFNEVVKFSFNLGVSSAS